MNDDYIESLFVPYKLALELRDLGFNKPCLATYRGGDLYAYLSGYYSDGNWDKHLSSGDQNQWVSTPTISQVLDWFETEHKFVFFIMPSGSPAKYDYVIPSCYLKDKNGSAKTFTTRREAELNLIEKLIGLCSVTN